MGSKNEIRRELRRTILAKPDIILEDQALMNALMTANAQAMGSNVFDIRGILMDRLESRLVHLEETHKNVVAAAYENLSRTNQIQRSVLRMMDAQDAQTFIKDLQTDVRDILRVEYIGLLLETNISNSTDILKTFGHNNVVKITKVGFIDKYLALGRNAPSKDVVLRMVFEHHGEVYGDGPFEVNSEALMKIACGTRGLPGMLVLGAKDGCRFSPKQGTDLLAFFASVFERLMWRWLT